MYFYTINNNMIKWIIVFSIFFFLLGNYPLPNINNKSIIDNENVQVGDVVKYWQAGECTFDFVSKTGNITLIFPEFNVFITKKNGGKIRVWSLVTVSDVLRKK